MDEDFNGMVVFVVLLVGLVGFIGYMAVKEQKKVDYCFMQEPRTKECELFLYKYENRKRHTTTVVQIPVVVRR